MEKVFISGITRHFMNDNMLAVIKQKLSNYFFKEDRSNLQIDNRILVKFG